jgi:hypothetical protein
MKTPQGGFLELLLYRHPSGAILNPKQAVERLKHAFPEVEFQPGDQLELSVARLEQATAEERARNPASPLHNVLASERRKAQTFGPAYAFQFPDDAPRHLRGRVRPFDIAFLYDTPLDKAIQKRILAFLLSFGVGWIKQSVADSRQSEILHDLPGVETGPPSSSIASEHFPSQGTKTS